MKLVTMVAIVLGLTCTSVYAVTKFKSINLGANVQTIAEKNLATGQEFLEKNKKLSGVITLADGLQYKIIQKGTGPKPSATDTVEVHYAGKLIDGTEFDSSYKRGQSTSFPVYGVIPGWTEALQLMNVGSKWEFLFPQI